MSPFRTAEPAEADAVLDTLMLAFAVDPVFRYWWPRPTDYLNGARAYAGAMCKPAYGAGSATVSHDLAAAAVWMPPGVGADPADLAALDLDGDETDTIGAELRREIDRFHPKRPHWYLWMIGVDPRRQGRGLGSAILAHTLRRCDADGLDAYLESSDPKNLPLYQRHGFAPLGVIQVRDIPPITPMIRPARR